MSIEDIELVAKYSQQKLSVSDGFTGKIDQIFLKDRILILHSIIHKSVGKGLLSNSFYEVKYYLDTKIRKIDYKKRIIANRLYEYTCKNIQKFFKMLVEQYKKHNTSKKKKKSRTIRQRCRWMWSTSLSTDTSGIQYFCI